MKRALRLRKVRAAIFSVRGEYRLDDDLDRYLSAAFDHLLDVLEDEDVVPSLDRADMDHRALLLALGS